MLLTTGLILIVLGVAVWLWGNRMWLLGAGAGALLGYGLLDLFPSLASGNMGLVVVVGLAVLLGVLAFLGKAFAKMVAIVVGFVIGGGVAMAFLGMLGLDAGVTIWVVAALSGLVVAVLFARFLDWALIIFASLLGSMLVVRGATAAFPDILSGVMGTAIVLVATAAGIYYHYRRSRPGA
jgi:hypothetical protein